MKSNLEDYYILSSIFVANNLIITFQYSLDIHSRLVLELKEVVGFIDSRSTDQSVVLRIDESGDHILSIFPFARNALKWQAIKKSSFLQMKNA